MSVPAIHDQPLGPSFRDPSGFLFVREGVLYRQINQSYAADYTRLMESGLYARLVQAGLLIPHQEVDEPPAEPALAWKIIRPEPLPFISYPYEWSFSQLKDAALATLEIQKQAFAFGLSLKDSSSYNIQFHRGRPVLIDTLSFETYPEGQPWVAYRQFCQHFLAPLSLMAYRDIRLSQLLRVYIDGVPLDLASSLLPRRTRFVFPLLTHIHLHAASQKRYAGTGVATSRQVSHTAFQGLIDSLESGVRGLAWTPQGTEWGDYEVTHNYSSASLDHKMALTGEFLDLALPDLQPRTAWDLGANTGRFSRLASQRGLLAVAFDIDQAAVERSYLAVKTAQEELLLPLLLDLTNPSPSLGWQNHERMSLIERGPAGIVLALALIHHLAISNNVPLDRLADFFHGLSRWLIIEFVPKDDPQVQRLLATRKDIFPQYTPEAFEAAFEARFIIHRHEPVRDTPRTLYLMERR